jgi:hypothetical protein
VSRPRKCIAAGCRRAARGLVGDVLHALCAACEAEALRLAFGTVPA